MLGTVFAIILPEGGRMIQRSGKLDGYSIEALDGGIGHIKQFLFDEEHLTIRYIVVDTGPLIFGRKVLISPKSVLRVNWDDKSVKVDLDKEQIKNSPEIDEKQPISRKKEAELHRYYNLPLYWTGMGVAGATMYPGAFGGTGPALPSELARRAEREAFDTEENGSHLRSTEEVTGYHIEASDGRFGHVDDFMIEDLTWIIRYLVVDTKDILPGKDVLISPQWITKISWMEQKVYVNLPKNKISNAPELKDKDKIDRAYEEGLFEYYGSVRYWL
jgi:hypothetical protein